jgi:CO/xanthine dehydrogenase FAD-binding subunit
VKAPRFDYHVPGTVDEACAAKGDMGRDAAVLAGGQSLIPLMASRRMSPRALIDIKRIPELGEARRDNGSLYLGAAVRHCRLHDDADVGAAVPVLAEAARYIGHIETRHRGTVGGSLAHADPVAELPIVAVGLGATIIARSREGERPIPAADFFTGARQTTLRPDEILVGVSIPVPGPGSSAGFAEIARRHGDPAMATAIAVLELDGSGAAGSVAVTVGGVAGRPQRAAAVESALTGATPTPETIARAARGAGELVEEAPEGPDVGPTPHPPTIPLSYRRRLAVAVTTQALTSALAHAHGGDAT